MLFLQICIIGFTLFVWFISASEKKIPHYKPTAKLLYFDRNEVEAWMKQNRVNTQAEAESAAAAYMVRKGAAL